MHQPAAQAAATGCPAAQAGPAGQPASRCLTTAAPAGRRCRPAGCQPAAAASLTGMTAGCSLPCFMLGGGPVQAGSLGFQGL
jgi:hypothetical protein